MTESRNLVSACLLFLASFASADSCDVDADGDVDRDDVRAIGLARNKPATGPEDPRDPDGDGVITILDARSCTLRCDLPRCVSPPTNTAPVITSSPNTTATVNAAYSYDVNASDVDSDRLAFSLDAAPAGMAIESETGLISWSPTSGQVGASSVAVRVVDGRGGFAVQSYIINVTTDNFAPVITSTPATSATVGVAYAYDIDATDADGDRLIYSLIVAPPGSSIDSATGLLNWTPTGAQSGTNAVTVQVDDGKGGRASQSFSITVNRANNSPSILTAPNTAGTVALPYSYDVDAADPDALDVLQYSLDIAPAGMLIEPTTGLISWIPSTDQLGPNAVTVRVEDGNTGVALQSYSVFVEGDTDPPELSVLTPAPDATVDVTPVLVRGSVNDESGIASVLVNGIEATLSGSDFTAVVDLTEGPNTLTILATDISGNATSETISLTLNSADEIGREVVFEGPPPLDTAILDTLPLEPTSGNPLVVEIDGGQVLVDLDLADPISGMARCTQWISSCTNPAEDRNLDDCARSAPTCSTSEPWLEPGACCPTECFDRYRAARLASTDPILAFDQVYLSDGSCFPGFTD